ncbi:hypothetical protein RI129_002900 [Pyrocoelia pectoralis]
MEQELENFLRKRKINETAINNMKSEKLDMEAVRQAEDHELQKFLPAFGDRTAVVHFCKRFKHNRGSLISKLTEKLKTKENKYTNDGGNDNYANKLKIKTGKYEKPTRMIEMGWMLNGAYVRQNKGGGTRRLSVLKTFKYDDLLKVAKDLFFPKGNSSKNHKIEEYDCKLLDYTGNEVERQFSVGDLFKITKLTTVRFYLGTVKKLDESDDEVLPQTIPSTSFEIGTERTSARTRSKKAIESTVCVDSKAAYMQPLIIDNISPPTETEELRHLTEKISAKTTTEKAVESTVCVDSQTPYIYINDNNSPETEEFQHSISFSEVVLPQQSFGDINEFLHFNAPPHLNENAIYDLEETEHFAVIKLNLHRGHIFEELTKEFETIGSGESYTMDIKVILPNGQTEIAFDNGGVLRDVLTEFWNSFYDECCEGATCKVPVIRHDYCEKKWRAIGKVLLIGYRQIKYFPTKLARAFVEYIILGNFSTDLINNLLLYVGICDANTLKSALKNFESVDTDDILDVMGNIGCKKIITKENFLQILGEIAHALLIQKPMFIIDTWQKILAFRISNDTLIEIYETLAMSNKNVLRILSFDKNEQITVEKEKVFEFLKKYIRDADQITLEKFTRFCTGADILTNNSITITFNTTEGFRRCPVGHTCACTLELSTTYQTYTEFKCEFNKLLNSSIWVMDLI